MRVELSIKPNFLEVREALAEIRSQLVPMVDEDPMNTIEIVGAEILNNVVEHGFADATDGTGRIDITAVSEGKALTFTVVDNGLPMPGFTPPEPKHQEIYPQNRSALPEGGFGWGLIHMLSGELNYAYEGGKNHLSVRISI